MIRLDSNASPISPKKIIRSFAILLVVLFIGTVGYMIIEKWKLLDALYMTVITITTVGYREVGNVSTAGRVFTIFIIFSGMGIIAYILGIVAQAMVDFQVRSIIGRRKLGKKMRSIKEHYILCGFGRIGRIIGRELNAYKIPMVVIDNELEKRQVFENEDTPSTSTMMLPVRMCYWRQE